MSTLVLRSVKGSPLTSAEIDANVTNLNTDKADKASPTFTGTVTLPNSLLQVTSSSYPTIQPTLNLDFANTKLLDPRITFVRNSTAAYYDGQTTAMAEQNLLLQSNTFSNAAWVATNGTVVSGVTDPAGTTTAFSFTATGVATLYQTLTTSATPYTLSFYIQRVTGTGAVNLTLDGTTLTAQTITGSWARYSVTATPTAASHTIGIQLAVITDSVNIFSSQLENRSSMTAANITTTAAITNYIPVLMTAPAGVARFDCDPITGKSLGLLIEESRTNSLRYSSDFSNAAWTKNFVAITTAANVAPDGTQTANNCVPDTSNSYHFVGSANFVSVASTAYSVSFYAKANGYSVVYGWNDVVGAGWSFNLLTGVATGTGGSMVLVGNGWYRCTYPFTPTGTTGAIRLMPNSSNTFVGDGYSGIYIWGAQVEAGSFATSYIPCVASTVTRAADQASMTGTNFSSWYNQAQGTILTEYKGNNNAPTASNYGIVAFGPGAYNAANSMTTFINAGGIVVNYNLSGTASSPIASTRTTEGKVCSSYSSTTISLTNNAGAVTTSATGSSVGGITSMSVGYSTLGLLNGHIRKLSYYPVALSSSNLVALTS